MNECLVYIRGSKQKLTMLHRLKIDDSNCITYLHMGDSNAYSYLIKIYYPPLLHFAIHIIPNDMPAAEDIVFETFLKAWRRASDFSTINHLKNFLYLSVRNACNNYLRGKQREQAKEDDLITLSAYYESPDEDILFKEIVHTELMANVRKAIDSLSPQMRRIFILSYVKQMNNYEIAKQLNLSYQTVRNQKSKSLTIIRKMLDAKNNTLVGILMLMKGYW